MEDRIEGGSYLDETSVKKDLYCCKLMRVSDGKVIQGLYFWRHARTLVCNDAASDFLKQMLQ